MSDVRELRRLVKELAKKTAVDPKDFCVFKNSYGEYETVYYGDTYSNCLTFEEAESEIRTIFKGIEIGKKEILKNTIWR